MDANPRLPENVWIAACAHELAKRWRTVDPEQLEGVAEDLSHDAHLRDMPPDQAAVEWLRPINPDERAFLSAHRASPGSS